MQVALPILAATATRASLKKAFPQGLASHRPRTAQRGTFPPHPTHPTVAAPVQERLLPARRWGEIRWVFSARCQARHWCLVSSRWGQVLGRILPGHSPRLRCVTGTRAGRGSGEGRALSPSSPSCAGHRFFVVGSALTQEVSRSALCHCCRDLHQRQRPNLYR